MKSNNNGKEILNIVNKIKTSKTVEAFLTELDYTVLHSDVIESLKPHYEALKVLPLPISILLNYKVEKSLNITADDHIRIPLYDNLDVHYYSVHLLRLLDILQIKITTKYTTVKKEIEKKTAINDIFDYRHTRREQLNKLFLEVGIDYTEKIEDIISPNAMGRSFNQYNKIVSCSYIVLNTIKTLDQGLSTCSGTYITESIILDLCLYKAS